MFFQSQAFPTEKSQILPGVFWFPKKDKGVQKSQNFKIWQIGNPGLNQLFTMEYVDGQVWEKYDYAVTAGPNTTVWSVSTTASLDSLWSNYEFQR